MRRFANSRPPTYVAAATAMMAALLAAGPAAAQQLRPFSMPWTDAEPGPTDLSFMNDTTGVVPLTLGTDGHFYRDGERYRL
jgi:hypothetical protein